MSINRFKKKNEKERTQKRSTLLNKEMPFSVVEAFKALRTNIMFAMSTRKNKIIAISSPLPGEGKSTISANLAITFAQADCKVILIDADLRKPVMHKTFDLENKMGLSTLLSGINSFKEVLNSQVAPCLDIITSGPIPPNPSEMLGSDNMRILLEKLSEFYDYIIIDTPPVNIVSDSLNLLPYIAGVVLVAKQGSTPKEEFEEAVNSIKFADGYLLGAVLGQTDFGGSKGGYKYRYRYKYRRGYRYRYKYKNYSYGYGNNSNKKSLTSVTKQKSDKK